MAQTASKTPPATPVSSLDAYTGTLFLFIVDTSSGLSAMSEPVQLVVADMIQNGLNGRMKKGDLFAIWTYNDKVNKTAFIPRAWDPDQARLISNQSFLFLQKLSYSKSSRLDLVMGELFQLVRRTPNMMVYVITDGHEPMRGTPYDGEIGAVYLAHYKQWQKDKTPCITGFLFEDGKFVNWAVGVGAPLTSVQPIAAMPIPKAPTPPPITNVVTVKTEPVQPAPPAPKPVAPPKPKPIVAKPPAPIQPVVVPAPQPKVEVPPSATLTTQTVAIAVPSSVSTPPPVKPVEPVVTAPPPVIKPPAPAPPQPTVPVAVPERVVPPPAPVVAQVPPPVPVVAPVITPVATPVTPAPAPVAPVVAPSSNAVPVETKLSPPVSTTATPPATNVVVAILPPAPVTAANRLLFAGLGLLAVSAILGVAWLRRLKASHHPSLISHSMDHPKPGASKAERNR